MTDWFRLVALAASLILGGAAPAHKPLPNPLLTAEVNGIEDGTDDQRALRISQLEADVTLRGAVAQAVLTARFDNPGRETLEGEFRLMLPAGAVVTGYALDSGGNMVSGVLVDRPKARAVYEDTVRRGIDPGVAEVSGNNFTTRVFPINPGSGRTVRVTFVAPADTATGFALPLYSDGPVGRFAAQVDVAGQGARPALRLPIPANPEWRRTADGYEARIEARDAVLTGELAIASSTPTAVLLSHHSAGETFIQITDVIERESTVRPPPGRVRIYWDRSLSRRDDRLEDEAALVERYLAATRPSVIEVVAFNSAGVMRSSTDSGKSAAAILGRMVYRGATSTAVLTSAAEGQADVCLLFSDGVTTIDDRDDLRPGCALTTITSDPGADQAYLRRLARQAGGDFLFLNPDSVDAALDRLLRGGPRVVDVRAADGTQLRYLPLPVSADHWGVVAEAPPSGEVIVRLSGARGRAARRYTASGPAARFDGDGALLAADRLSTLDRPEQRDAMRLLARRYSVAGPAMAFLVFEEANDYVAAEVEPPADYPKDRRAEYRRLKADAEARAKVRRAERLGEVVEAWSEQKAWWSTRFDPRAKPKKMRRDVPAPPPPPRVALDIAPPPMPAPAPSSADVAEEVGEVIVTGSRRQPQVFDSPVAISGATERDQRSTAVELAPWSPDRPYLKALDKASDVGATLAAQERRHGTLPAFYLDVAEWLFRKGRRADAIEMVLSALELPAANDETRAVVAARLARYGAINRAVWLRERVAADDDSRPQPRRDLALALMKRAAGAPLAAAKADLRRAVTLFSEIALRPWDGDFDGIELIALMEANEAIARLKRLGVEKVDLDPRLVTLLDVDLRVVLEWNTDATDMDLWIDEPNGERAIYNNPKTVIGGRLSNDMTDGYGPEEYLLRRAPPGEYRISANVYAADRINPNGATTVTARLIRDFGRPTQREEVVDVELLPSETGERYIGKLVAK